VSFVRRLALFFFRSCSAPRRGSEAGVPRCCWCEISQAGGSGATQRGQRGGGGTCGLLLLLDVVLVIPAGEVGGLVRGVARAQAGGALECGRAPRRVGRLGRRCAVLVRRGGSHAMRADGMRCWQKVRSFVHLDTALSRCATGVVIAAGEDGARWVRGGALGPAGGALECGRVPRRVSRLECRCAVGGTWGRMRAGRMLDCEGVRFFLLHEAA